MEGNDLDSFKHGTIRKISSKKITTLQWSNGKRYYGIDLASEKFPDQGAITVSKINDQGQIVSMYIDEYSRIPVYKWYKNPIKWWEWRRLMRSIKPMKFDKMPKFSAHPSKDNHNERTE